MDDSEDWCAELLSKTVSDLEDDGTTYLVELVSELETLLRNDLLGSPKPAEFKEMARRLGKANRGKS